VAAVLAVAEMAGKDEQRATLDTLAAVVVRVLRVVQETLGVAGQRRQHQRNIYKGVTHTPITQAVLAVLAVLAVRERDTLVRQDQVLQDQAVALLQMRVRAARAVMLVLAVPLVLRGQRARQARQAQTQLALTERLEVEQAQRERRDEPLLLLVSQHTLL
jgi:hypothetical protein